MARITAKRRRSLPKSKFALRGSRKYLIDTRARAANAKGRATQQYKKGNISLATKNRVHAAANRVLKKKKTTKRRRK